MKHIILGSVYINNLVKERGGKDRKMSIENGLLKNLKLLYVEDDPEVVQQMSFFLKKRVGKLIVAENGIEGLKLFKEHLPDLILSDLQMPGMDGMQMAKEIRKVSDIPIIISTAFSEKDIILKAVDLGIENYIVKPIDVRELVRVLDKTAVKIHRIKGTLLKLRNQKLLPEEKVKAEENIKNAFAKVIKDKSGKGPQNVKAFIHGEVLEVEILDSFTKLEKTLLEIEKNNSIVVFNREVFYKDCEVDFKKIFQEALQGDIILSSVEIDSSKDITRLEFVVI